VNDPSLLVPAPDCYREAPGPMAPRRGCLNLGCESCHYGSMVPDLAFVLVRPKAPGNIGATARAMKNMGFADLRLVAPQRWNQREAAAMAAHGGDVLAAATTYPDIAGAVADRSTVIGTTARGGLYREDARSIHDTAAEIAALGGPAAILFGPEDFGLTNDDLKSCQRLVTIPTAPAYRSLNLAQAVLIVAYEMMLAADGAGPRSAPVQLAQAAGVDAMFARMADALMAIGFLPADNPDHVMFAIRSIFGRAGLRPRELDILNGLARQIRWAAEGGHETIAAKRKAGIKLR
jgi:tRNA/rRNA methyltransferase